MSAGRRKPKLAIDVSPLLEDQWTGIPVFTRRLVQALQRDGGVDLEFFTHCVAIPPDRVDAAIRINTGSFLRESLAGVVDDARVFDRSRNLLFPTVKSAWTMSSHEASTIHDMSTLFMPENHEEENIAFHLDHLKDELRTDEVVFCVSEATRNALVAAFPSAERKARLIYQYADWPKEFAIFDRNLPAPKVGRYAAVVGTIEPRKNLGLLIRALALPGIARSELKFVVIGRKGWLVDRFLDELTDAQRSRLVFTGFVSEFAKYRVIKHAEFLIFPSLYEGFGIPAVEAMSLGKPVLASRTSSFPEVIGDAGVYFDPLSVSEFAAAFDEIEAPARRRELAPRALAQSRAFGPERMAQPVLQWVNERDG
ncbi:glycosyltransferase family 4 protein [Rhodopseudomonas palustris]|uniref:glycosyltransferase family 4 protein n=1 Tax=Rhodopseudomonas palustris TaxID=1076 RepID=UPI000E5C3583|nr:glycosyltransferase family 1 protein [Rhodopseudomonas palustris]QLH71661.1 glycosyltransferase family 4 protein [Rhodopseudomonas palustris]RIA02311.1 glycosyltransferase family 1 protein [Rhodopseudomonas palustris]